MPLTPFQRDIKEKFLENRIELTMDQLIYISKKELDLRSSEEALAYYNSHLHEFAESKPKSFLFPFLIGAAIIVAFIATSIRFRVEQKYVPSFCGKFKNSECYGLEIFKRDLRELMDRPNPMGIIFVSGAKNSGKTTVIKSTLEAREHVVCLNIRAANFESELDFVKFLKNSFDIKQFENLKILLNLWFFTLEFDWQLSSPVFPDYRRIDEILRDMEIALTQAYFTGPVSGVSKRPVFFMDEIGNLQSMVIGDEEEKKCVKYFINWIVMMSKDKGLCDVVFASHDGFALETLSLADPLYTVPKMIPNLQFREMEIQMLSKKYKHITREYISMVISLVGTLGTSEYISLVTSLVGTLGSHVMHLLPLSDSKRLHDDIALFYHNERETLAGIRRRAEAPSNWGFTRTEGWGYYLIDEFNCIMNELIFNPSVKLDWLLINLRDCAPYGKIDKELIKFFSNEGWLVYDPEKSEIQARNKIFLNVYRKKTEYDAELKPLLDLLTTSEKQDHETQLEYNDKLAKTKEKIYDKIKNDNQLIIN